MIDERETRSQLLPVDGRVVMISGGSTGIGAAIVRRLMADGFRLSLGVRRADQVRAKYADQPIPPLVSRFDAFEPATAAAWLDATLAAFGRLDALINNAGLMKPLSFDSGDESALDDLWAVNVKAPFRLIRLAL